MRKAMMNSIRTLYIFLALGACEGQDVPAYDKVLVVGGRSSDGDQLNGGEVLDLSGSGGDASCVPVPQYPRLVEFAAGAFVNALGDGRDVPLVCGGATNVGTSGECFAFDKYGSFAWAQVASLGAERAEHAGSVFPDGSFWVTGGIDLDRRYTLTTELWSGGISVPGPQLPLPTGGHCQVTIDDNVAFIGGGYTSLDGGFSAQTTTLAYLIDKVSGEVTSLPPLPEPTEYPACGLATRPGGSRDVVVTTEDNTFLFDLNTRVWREAVAGDSGTDLYAASAQQGDQTFFMIGGIDDGAFETNSTYRYEPDTETWTLLDARLTTPKRSAVAIPVSDEFAECT